VRYRIKLNAKIAKTKLDYNYKVLRFTHLDIEIAPKVFRIIRKVIELK
jgi:CO dehydrogenase/acetyl-CoA synthase delta subunit